MSIPLGQDIEYAAKLIRQGKLVAFPTETVYGLGADAFNIDAVIKIFEVKNRPTFDPLIVHIYDFSQLELLWEYPINPLALKLAKQFWPGSLTIVHKKKHCVPDIITAGLQTVAVRMPSNTIAKKLLQKSQTPIVAPSANKFGALTSTKPQHVLKQFNENEVSYIIDNNEELKGVESTVVLVQDNKCYILRDGAICEEEISQTLNIQIFRLQNLNNEDSNEHNKNLLSPGLLKSHYAPQKPLYILKNNDILRSLPPNSGLIIHSEQSLIAGTNATKVLYTSKNFSYHEIAKNLFNALHTMEDDPNITQIFIEPVKEKGLGRAIMDRITKASFKYSTNEISK